MKNLVKILQKSYPYITFKQSSDFRYNSKSRTVYYSIDNRDLNGSLMLLHETAHALLGHNIIGSDFELLKLELEAYEKAKTLAKVYDIEFSNEQIEEYLDTYRYWIYERSTCPNCGIQSLQEDDSLIYKCFNCNYSWEVSASKFCRIYKKQKALIN